MTIFNAANILTFGNFLSGFLAIIFVVMEGNIVAGGYCIGIGVLFDLFDGRAARKFNLTSSYGAMFDTFSDFLTFGLAPAFLYIKLIQSLGVPSWNGAFNVLLYVIAFIYILATAARLIKFHAITGKAHRFSGLPSTLAAPSMVLLLTFHFYPTFFDLLPESQIKSIYAVISSFNIYLWEGIFVGLPLVYALLMILPIQYKKASPQFLSFRPSVSNFKKLMNVLFLLGFLIFFKFFLIIAFTMYIISPLVYRINKVLDRKTDRYYDEPGSLQGYTEQEEL